VASLGDAIYGLGIKSHLIVAPNDAHYGILGGLLKDALIAKGVTADLMLIAPTQVDYASDVAAAGRKASDMGAVSIMLLSDSDPTLINFETHAMRDPVLSTLKWWGTDQIGHTSMYPPAASEEIAKFLKERGWMGATIPDPKGSQADEVVKKYGDRTSGAKPWMYMVSDYDAAWLTMEAMKQCKNDGPRMIATFPEICKRYSGVTGPTLLDKNGDLIASSVQYIRINDSLTGMEAIGTYNMQLGGVITYTKTPPSYDYETHTVINQ
jgi:branched-chain amino acid transport system substrate-binding protein